MSIHKMNKNIKLLKLNIFIFKGIILLNELKIN
jgi:hypothetical protein